MDTQSHNNTFDETSLADEICAYIFKIEDKTRQSIADISKENHAQERLLEATMILFDAMKDNKPLIEEWRTRLLRHPAAAHQIAPVYYAALSRMMDVLDITILTTKTLLTQPYLQVFEHAMRGLVSPSPAFLYASGFIYWIKVWLHDESVDECDTMSVIDGHLGKFC